MFHSRRTASTWVLTLTLGIGTSCTDDVGQPNGPDAGPIDTGVIGNPGDGGTGPDIGPPPEQLPASERPKIKFKRREVLASELSIALGIDVDELCKELDLYSCFNVHRIPLGGVEPYTLGVVEALDTTAATTPMVVDRVVLAACRNRVDGDLAGADPSVRIFDLDVDAQGALDPSSPKIGDSLTTLYRRVLKRDPTPAEIQHLADFYGSVSQSSPRPARDWALLSCYSVTTTMEALFY